MARPDDDHVPRAIVGADGKVIAVAHVAPDISDEALGHLREVIEAARRLHAETDTPERRARYEAGQARIRERLERIRGTPGATPSVHDP